MAREVRTTKTEEDYLRLVPPHLYVSAEAATKICELRHYGRRLQALDPDWEGALWPEIPS